ncbi:class I SAM-dependent methyltransferase [Asticcacaulis sp. EMRT-3]|uniref:class I SAM-dependent methyltransferase n=1 Tax=Asticcacaulis sp. EMRT-3 TaxID=3040349 RepID=UPI0024AF77C8|nr:class I SAM-dependent methyltransferase [Asticcacaulis sp. EMRT-3]MDI7776628.1 class I SAM-dependent methyltransferase [Asticcacaulis sp. EMRT-3]
MTKNASDLPPNPWNSRFDRADYLFGTEPSAFVKANAHWLTSGLTSGRAPAREVFLPADGEGRNSTYLAGLGHKVTASDYSTVALEKARTLAASKGVSVDFRQVDLNGWAWPQSRFDAVVAVFIQFADPSFRTEIFNGIKGAIRPGGLILLHGYTPKQLEYKTGGPSQVENLYTEALLTSAFAGWQIHRLTSYEADLTEGAGHNGRSALIDFIARKPD